MTNHDPRRDLLLALGDPALQDDGTCRLHSPRHPCPAQYAVSRAVGCGRSALCGTAVGPGSSLGSGSSFLQSPSCWPAFGWATMQTRCWRLGSTWMMPG